MYVSNKTDVVSNELRRTHYWEKGEINEILSAIKSVQEKRPDHRPSFLDIGANLGWFSFNVLKETNADVLAFEAMIDNVHLIRSSMCKNHFADRMTLIGFGLGRKETSCAILAHPNNMMNGVVKCGLKESQLLKITQHGLKGDSNNKLIMLGSTSIQKLDAIVDRQIDVMKMDVEGFEYDVFRGGMEFFSRNPVGFILMEFNTAYLSANSVANSEMFGQLENW
eukprot:CAMPEP_0119035328 /NCGR_PEP_ID=MMETSP1177-20130426/2255_1 /TAXON_ID=2985 /ORGANISM="Ochromonas sp, Strain CCMP1899" /LENGTH=222 /DNA_ID=CAMNT_0006993387 /DNA_START=399 /DNA_END=1064 /DNA_ORIENTATION=+